MKRVKSFVLLIIIGLCLYVLLFRAEWLVFALLDKPAMPVGSIIVCIFFVAYSLFMYQISPDDLKSKSGKMAKKFLKYLIYQSFFWGIVSFLLSGNWAFNFANKVNFAIWIIYTALILILPLVILTVLFIGKRISRTT